MGYSETGHGGVNNDASVRQKTKRVLSQTDLVPLIVYRQNPWL